MLRHDLDDEDVNGELAVGDFLMAYRQQLRHIKLVVSDDPDRLHYQMLLLIARCMPQLESLQLAAEMPPPEEKDNLELMRLVNMQLPSPPIRLALSALGSLILHQLYITNAVIDRVLASCPKLLVLSIDRVGPLTSAVWTSILQCRQLL